MTDAWSAEWKREGDVGIYLSYNINMTNRSDIYILFDMMRGAMNLHDMKRLVLSLFTVQYMLSKSNQEWSVCKEKYGYYLTTTETFLSIDWWKLVWYLNDLSKQILSQTSLNIDISLYNTIPQDNLKMIVRKIWNIDIGNTDWGELFMNIIIETTQREWRTGGEYFTAPSLAQLIIALGDPLNAKDIYDPTMWIGTLLQWAKKMNNNLNVYGQEISQETHSIALMYSIVCDSFIDSHLILGDTLSNQHNFSQKFDLVLSNSPFWIKVDWDELSQESPDIYQFLSRTWDIAFIQHALYHLNNNWKYIAIIPMGILFRWWEEQRYREYLLNEWIIESVILLPSWLFQNTGVPCSIIVFNKSKQFDNVLFIDASDMFEINNHKKVLSTNNIDTIVSIYNSRQAIGWTSATIANSDIIQNNSNLSIPHYIDKFEHQFENIRVNHPEYQHYTLWELVNINNTVQEIETWLYLSKKWGINLKKLYTYDDIHNGGNDSKDFMEVNFKDDLVLSKYFEFFLESDMWEVSLWELEYRSHWTVSRFWYADNIEHLNSLRIILPPLSEQTKIVEAYSNLEKVIDSIQQIKKDLVVNPSTANQATEQSFKILESLTKLSDADKILELIRRWEGKDIEFKETLHYNEKADKQKDEDLITASIKNIVAFLNTNGWNLLVGVHDNGEIIGIERDLKQYSNIDKFFLYIKDKLKKRIWEQFLQYINYDIIKVNNKDVLWFQCSNSKKECFLDEKSFYIRANPSAEELAWPKLQDYINTHFKNSN